MASLSQFLGALPEAAKSGRALTAYVVVVVCWTAIAWRVRRFQTLLRHLDKIPSEDRGEVLRREMGVREVRALSAKQWLTSRIHQYLLIGFLALLILVAYLCTLAYSRPASTPPLTRKDLTSAVLQAQSQGGFSAEAVMLSQVSLVLSEQQLKELLVFPPLVIYDGSEGRLRVLLFRRQAFYLMAYFDKEQRFVGYDFLSIQNEFHPSLPTILFGLDSSLGKFSFAEALPNNQEPYHFNFGGRFTDYAEQASLPSSENGDVWAFLSYSSPGADYEHSDPGARDLSLLNQDQVFKQEELMVKWSEDVRAFRRSRPSGINVESYKNYRHLLIPNGYSVWTDPGLVESEADTDQCVEYVVTYFCLVSNHVLN